MKQTVVEIGGLPISFQSDRIILGEKYIPFVSHKNPLLVVRASLSEIPKSRSKETTFSKRHVFQVSRRDDGFLIQFKNLPHTPRAILIQDTFKKATFFLRDRKIFLSRSASSFPWPYLLIHYLLSRGRGIFIHACSVIHQGKGFLFVGGPGSGKSTIARLLHGEKEFLVLNDENTIVRKIRKKMWIFGTPWHGAFTPFASKQAPLKRLFFLSHGKKNRLRSLSAKESMRRLLPQTWFRSWDPDGIPFSLQFSLDLCAEIPSYELAFAPDKRIVSFLNNEPGSRPASPSGVPCRKPKG